MPSMKTVFIRDSEQDPAHLEMLDALAGECTECVLLVFRKLLEATIHPTSPSHLRRGLPVRSNLLFTLTIALAIGGIACSNDPGTTRQQAARATEQLKQESVASDIAALLRGNKDGGLKGVAQVLSMLPVSEKESVLKFLSSA